MNISFPTSFFSFDTAILLLSGGCVQRGRVTRVAVAVKLLRHVRVEPHRIIGQEPPRHGVIVPRLHIGETGCGVVDMAGEALVIGGGVVQPFLAKGGVVLLPLDRPVGLGLRNERAQMILMAIADRDDLVDCGSPKRTKIGRNKTVAKISF